MSVISQYSGEYRQWISTQNVCKKMLHALHFIRTILITYFSSYIKKCQTGIYFFGWVYITTFNVVSTTSIYSIMGGGAFFSLTGAKKLNIRVHYILKIYFRFVGL